METEREADDMKRIFGWVLVLVMTLGLLPFMAAPQAVANPSDYELVKLVDNGPDDENIVLTFTGIGFATADDMELFVEEAARFAEEILNFYPFNLFQDRFNVYAIKLVWHESGYDPSMFSVGSTQRALEAHGLSHGFTIILLNTKEWSGLGSGAPTTRIATSGIGPDCPEIAIHELGHLFGLGYKRWPEMPSWLIERDYQLFRWPNISTDNNPNTMKWRHWLGHEGIGIHQFSPPSERPRYFIPGTDCMMKSNTGPFCAVCSSHLTGRFAAMTGEMFYGLSTIGNVTVPDGTKRILNYAFYGSGSLRGVSIPASVAEIGRYAFLGCTGLETVINLAATPQTIGSTVFAGVTLSNVTLHVPEGTSAAYEAAGWTGFKEIIEFDPASPPALSQIIIRSLSPDNSSIDLITETIHLDNFTPVLFSVTTRPGQGHNFRRFNADKFDLSRLLNKGWTSLQFRDSWGVGPVVEFPAVNARPKRNAERLVPSYGDSHWVLARRNTTAAVFTGYEYAPSSNGRTPDNGQWFQMPEGGIPIVEGRNRPTFLVRAAPSGTTPASVPWRVRPANFSKAPTYSIRDARVSGNADRVPAIAFRKGDQYTIGDGDFIAPLTDKTTIAVSQLSAQGTELRIRRAATGRRPPSLTQTITLPTG
jgi:hypothetical protein